MDPAHKNVCHLSQKVLLQNKCRNKTEEKSADPGSSGKQPLNLRFIVNSPLLVQTRCTNIIQDDDAGYCTCIQMLMSCQS